MNDILFCFSPGIPRIWYQFIFPEKASQSVGGGWAYGAKLSCALLQQGKSLQEGSERVARTFICPVISLQSQHESARVVKLPCWCHKRRCAPRTSVSNFPAPSPGSGRAPPLRPELDSSQGCRRWFKSAPLSPRSDAVPTEPLDPPPRLGRGLLDEEDGAVPDGKPGSPRWPACAGRVSRVEARPPPLPV